MAITESSIRITVWPGVALKYAECNWKSESNTQTYRETELYDYMRRKKGMKHRHRREKD